MNRTAKFSELVGETLAAVEGKVGGEEVVFVLDSGKRYRLFHEQNCCEKVTVIDICGDLADLVGTPVVVSEERVSTQTPQGIGQPPVEDEGTFTWTFYTLATAKGYVTIRWFGTSNGYYAESVDFEEMEENSKKPLDARE